MQNLRRWLHDIQRLKQMCINLLVVPATNCDDQPTPNALATGGIVGFNADFISISEADINTLTASAGHNLTLNDSRKLKIALAYYHFGCRHIGEPMNISSSDMPIHDKFR